MTGYYMKFNTGLKCAQEKRLWFKKKIRLTKTVSPFAPGYYSYY